MLLSIGVIMASENQAVNELIKQTYKHGFETEIEADTLPPGLNGPRQKVT